jgi:arsenate reductase
MSGMVKLFHNPECSKSRAVLNLLKENKIKPQIIKYLEVLLSKETIEDILKKLGREPRDIIRKNESCYITKKLGNKKLTRSELIQIIIQNPILLERPVVIANNKAVIGRPPYQY